MVKRNKEVEHLTRLDLALLIVLSNYDYRDTHEQKDYEKKNEYRIKNGWLTQEDILKSNKLLNTIFTSPETSIPKYLKKLHDLGFIEQDILRHIDTRKVERKHKMHRIKRDIIKWFIIREKISFFDVDNAIKNKINLFDVDNDTKDKTKIRYLAYFEKTAYNQLYCHIPIPNYPPILIREINARLRLIHHGHEIDKLLYKNMEEVSKK